MADVEYKIKFDADASGAKKGFSELANSASKAASKITSAMNNIEKSVLSGFGTALKAPGKALMNMASGFIKVLKGVLIGGGAALVGAAYKGIEAANDLNDAIAITDTAYGKNAAEMHEWAKESASAYGLARTQAEKYFGSIGEYLKNAGVSSDQSAVMAKNMAAKAGELSRSYGVSSDKAMEELTKGVQTGKDAGLRQYGVILSEDAYNQELFAEGINKAYSELSAEDQYIVRYNTLMTQLGDVTGSTAGEFSTWEGAVAGLVSNTKDALATFGQIIQAYLLPVVQLLAKIMQSVSAALSNLLGTLGIETSQASSVEDYSEAIEDLGKATQKTGSQAKKASGGLASFDKINNMTHGSGAGGGAKEIKATAKAMDLLGDSAKNNIKPLKEWLEEFMQADWEGAGHTLGEKINGLLGNLDTFSDKLKEGELGTKMGEFLSGLTEEGVWYNASVTLLNLVTGLLTEVGNLFASAPMGEIGHQIITGLADGLELNEDEILTALKNIGNGIADFFINFFDPSEFGRMGVSLGNIVNGLADDSNGQSTVSKIAQGITNIILSLVEFVMNFVKTVDWLNLAKEILSGIGTALYNAISEDPGLLFEALGTWLTWDAIKGLFKGLSDIGTGIGSGIADGINSTTVSGGVLEVAMAGVKAILAAGALELADYLDSIKKLEESTANMKYYTDDYQGMTQSLKITAEADLNEANSRIINLTNQLGTLDSQLANNEIDATEYAQKYGFLAQSLAEAYNVYGLDTGALLKSAKELQEMDLDELTDVFRDEGEVKAITASEQEIWGMLMKSAKDWDESYKAALNKSDSALKDVNEGATKAEGAAKNVGEKTSDLAKAAKELSEVDLPAFKSNLEELETPLDNFITRVQTIVELKWDGQLADLDALQTNMDNAYLIVDDAIKKIDKAIADSTNLKNFETTLSSTQTIKVDTSGKFGVTVDAKAHIDSSELASWYDEFTMGNKNSRG